MDRARRRGAGFPRLCLATAAAVPVGALVSRSLSFDIVSIDGVGAWAVLLWPAVLLGLGAAAVVLVALPVGLLFRRPTAPWCSIGARSACEAAVGTALFRAVSFPISWSETALIAVPQLVFFGVLHALEGRRERAVSRAALPDSG